MNKIITTLIALIVIVPATFFAQENGRIKVTVLDENRSPMPGVMVSIVAGGPTTGGPTDLDGIYTFAALNPGMYDVQARVTGYKKYIKTGINVSAGQTAYAEYVMQPTMDTTGVIVITATQSPVDPTFSTIQNLNATSIKTMAADRGNIAGMVTGVNSQTTTGKNGQLVMRGSREGASQVYVDGEVMYGSSNVPAGSIQQVSILTGGIPAEYGDLSGGAIIITTQSYYTGAAQHNRMYQAAAEEEAKKQAAADSASGKRIENKDQIIEKDQQPQGEEQPAPEEDPKPEAAPAQNVEPK